MEEIKIKVQKNENIMKMHHLGGGYSNFGIILIEKIIIHLFCILFKDL